MVIRHLGPLSLAKVGAVIYAIFGFILGCFFALLALGGGMSADAADSRVFGALFGVGAIVAFPIFYGCLGFVGLLFAGWLYNLVAGVVGGVEVDLQ